MADRSSDDPWADALGLAWEAFCAGATPIGAVVLDGRGRTVARARGQRAAGAARVPGQLAGTRIAHAEVNALAQLPFDASYGDHVLYTTVEPCCLCMGAALQTGIGKVRYAQADAYAGAASSMEVRNPQVRRRRMDIEGPVGGTVSRRSGLLVAMHYTVAVDRPLAHVVEPLRRAEPDLFSLAVDPGVQHLIRQARRALVPADELFERIDRMLT